MASTTKHIVFDWNGTLLDDFHAIHQATNHILQSQGHAIIDGNMFRTHYAIPFEGFYRNLGLNTAQTEKMLQLENSTFHDHYEPLANASVLREGAVEALEHAWTQGLKCYILSNHLVEPIRFQLHRLKIDHYFTEVLAYASRAVQFQDMTKGERLRRYMAQHNIPARETLIVGDTPEETHIAHEQGLTSVAITGGCASEEKLRKEKPNFIIHQLPELKAILKERVHA